MSYEFTKDQGGGFEANIQRQDHEDLNNEIAGRSTGRAVRFLTQDDSDAPDSDARKNSARAFQTALDLLLLSDPIYAARYETASTLLSNAETATESALKQARTDLIGAQGALEDILDRSNRLPDGTRVFRAANGRIFDEHGFLVGEEEAASIVWRENAPSYEAYRQSKDRVTAVEGYVQDLQQYQVDILGSWRDQLENTDQPPSLEELDQLQLDILEKAPEAVRVAIEPDAPVVTSSVAPATQIDVPKL